MTDDPTAIARTISPAQRIAVLGLPEDGSCCEEARGSLARALQQLADMGVADECYRFRTWRLLPLGLLVRAEIVKMMEL